MKEAEAFDPFAMMQRVIPASSALNAATRQNAANFWEAQEKLLGCMQEFANGWFERRHVGTQSALVSARDICNADSPFDALREYQKWAIGSLERVMQDGLACQKQLIEIGRLGTQPLVQATENVRATESAAEPAPAHRSQSRARAA
jgi:hypothetical protein